MPLETFPFDAAEYLDTPEAQAAFLDDALSTDDPAEVTRALATVARARAMVAAPHGADRGPEGMADILPRNENPELGTVLKAVRALGLRLGASPSTS